MQPIVKDKQGTLRFAANTIVDRLYDEALKHGFGLSDLVVVCQDALQADWEQFYQLIGYSISGYHELSLVSDKSALEASKEARKISPGAGGCRDDGCELHCGVSSENNDGAKQEEA